MFQTLKNTRNECFYLYFSEENEFISHLGHFSPFVLKPHFLQCTLIVKDSCDGVFIIFTIKTSMIRIPTAIPIQTNTNVIELRSSHFYSIICA